MLPDDIALLLERVGHRLAVGEVAVEAADNQQPRIAAYFHCMAIAAVGREHPFGIVLDRLHLVVSFNTCSQGIGRADQFLANVCAQLIARYDLPYPALPPERRARQAEPLHWLLVITL